MSLYPQTLVRKTVGRKRYRAGMAAVHLFTQPPSSEEIARQQVERFNRAWAQALQSPFYRKWAVEHQLPAAISDLGELEGWPVLTRADLRRDEDLVWEGFDRRRAYSTSGTTSDPMFLPEGEEDFYPAFGAMWSYRGAAGLKPFDSFTSVGNLHMGTMNGGGPLMFNVARRHLKDIAGNSWKINAMHRDAAYLDHELRRLLKMRPSYLVGYTSAVEALARRAAETRVLQGSGYVPRAAILSSERISEEAVRIVTDAFGTTVLSEYGAREIGVIAASTPESTWPMRTVWHHCILRADAGGRALVTTINRRSFPLINYDTGDLITPLLAGPGGTVLELGPIRGRTVDILKLPDCDGVIQSYPAMGLADSVTNESLVEGIQVVQHEGMATLLAVAPKADPVEYLARAGASLRATYPQLGRGTIRLALIDEMVSGARGKRQMMVKEEALDFGTLKTTLLN